jgi:RNA polymerase sigma-70 factor, ECF subfamily
MANADPELIARARSGDRQAFGKLVELYQRRVYATARRMMGGHADADDVMQEAFLRAFRGLKGFDGRADFFTWLYRIVINVALNQLRAGGRRPVEVELASPDPTARLEARERAERTRAAVLALPGAIRAALVLHVIEGLPQAEVAHILECAEGTVAWRVNQARKLLRDELGEPPPNEDSDGTG